MQNYNCIFDPVKLRLIDVIPEGSDGKAWFEKHGNEYGDNLIVLSLDEGAKRQEESFKSPPQEISEEKWMEMLCVLPPVSWKHDSTGESFKLSERTSGTITAIFVRIGQRFFTFSDSIYTPHAECVARVFISDAFRK